MNKCKYMPVCTVYTYTQTQCIEGFLYFISSSFTNEAVLGFFSQLTEDPCIEKHRVRAENCGIYRITSLLAPNTVSLPAAHKQRFKLLECR